jgi:hypothetical protein
MMIDEQASKKQEAIIIIIYLFCSNYLLNVDTTTKTSSVVASSSVARRSINISVLYFDALLTDLDSTRKGLQPLKTGRVKHYLEQLE